MILYHGSNIFIDKIDISKCRPYKDFGRGFYCTTIKEQAELMAKRVSAIYGGNPIITEFDLCEDIYKDKAEDLSIKEFKIPSKELAVFVLNNRNRHFIDFESTESNHDNKYDMVVGPVADDALAVLLEPLLMVLLIWIL